MPQLFRIGSLVLYFWSNESGEPVHIHVSVGRQSNRSSKFWLTRTGGVLLEDNGSRLSPKEISMLTSFITLNHTRIVNRWRLTFHYVRFVDGSDPSEDVSIRK